MGIGIIHFDFKDKICNVHAKYCQISCLAFLMVVGLLDQKKPNTNKSKIIFRLQPTLSLFDACEVAGSMKN